MKSILVVYATCEGFTKKVTDYLAQKPARPVCRSSYGCPSSLFAEVTERCIRRGSHTAVRALEKAMLDYLDQRHKNPKPFVWTADADLILGKVALLSKRISDSGH
jgi:hypothetical protein